MAAPEDVHEESRTVARRLRAALAESGLSQNDLGRRSGIDQSRLSKLLLGKANFTLDNVVRCAEVLGIAVTDLMRAGDDPVAGVRLTEDELAVIRAFREAQAASGLTANGAIGRLMAPLVQYGAPPAAESPARPGSAPRSAGPRRPRDAG